MTTGSLLLLELLISVVCREEHHRHEECIKWELSKFMKRYFILSSVFSLSFFVISNLSFSFRQNFQQAQNALNICFNVFTKDCEHKALTRRAVIDKVCLVLLQATTVSVLREFYVQNVKKIMEIVETRITKVLI